MVEFLNERLETSTYKNWRLIIKLITRSNFWYLKASIAKWGDSIN